MSLRGNEQICAFLDKLTASTNVSNYVELPMIAVMGETSSGKSSLLSSISGVELPSSSELTTRCPIMLQMSRAQERKAVINVQWKDIPEGKQKKDIEFQTTVVTDKKWKTLPDVIARAQKHIIDLSGKEVARDIVQVKVEGPHCEDLTLVDLPGIVRTRGINEGKTIVEDIKALIDDYLTNSRCVILAVVPANVDFHNSQIMADAQKVDPETKRTIPVITKPDLIDAGAEGDVVDLLLGRKTSKFQIGFHMVKGRGQAQLDKKVTIEEGLENEDAYFKNEQPWRGVTERGLFGIENLRQKLGQLQVSMAQEHFTAIIDNMKDKHGRACEELATIGDIPNSDTERKLFFSKVSDDLVASISMMMHGSNPRARKYVIFSEDVETVPAQLIPQCEEYQLILKSSKFANISSIEVGTAVLVSLGQGETVRGNIIGKNDGGDFFVDYEDRETNERRDFIVQKALPLGNEQGKTWRSLCGNICISDGAGHYDELQAIPAKKVRRDPSWILPWMKQNRTDDLPVFMNSALFQAIVMRFIHDEWRKPSQDLVKQSHQLILKATEGSLEKSKQLNNFPGLQSIILRKLKERADLLARKAEVQVQHFIEKELTPYTQDHYLFENLTKKRLEPFRKQLKIALGLDAPNASLDSNATLSKKSIDSVIDAVFDRNQRKSIDEHMAEDMQITLDAYGKVALKRFIDGVPMECWKILREYPQEVKKALLEVPDRDLQRCLVACNNVQRRRAELKVMADELKAGLDVLESLW